MRSCFSCKPQVIDNMVNLRLNLEYAALQVAADFALHKLGTRLTPLIRWNRCHLETLFRAQTL